MGLSLGMWVLKFYSGQARGLFLQVIVCGVFRCFGDSVGGLIILGGVFEHTFGEGVFGDGKAMHDVHLHSLGWQAATVQY